MKKKKQENTVLTDPTPENLARIQRLRLMDDDFFSEALDGKIEAVQFILNTILERDDLRVLHTSAQKTYRSAENRSVTMDIWAEDAAGRTVDIEIQRDDHGAGEKRACMHSSMLDRNLLKKGSRMTLCRKHLRFSSRETIFSTKDFRCIILTEKFLN